MTQHDLSRPLGSDDSDTAVIELPKTSPPQARRLPPWQVLLHNDDVNEVNYVVRTIVELTPLPRTDATMRMLEAHKRGVSLLLETHREHAELLEEQFTSKRLTVTIEPAR